jgi:transposase
MKQIKLHLSEADRTALRVIRGKGIHSARELNRAHILAALDQQVSETRIIEVLGVGRTTVWRTRSAYLEKGLEYALSDLPRPGQPLHYPTNQQAEVVALACSQAPAGAKRWTIRLLTQAARKRPGLKTVSRESVRRFLKKTSASPGAK